MLWLNGVTIQDKDISPLGLLRLLRKERDTVLSLVGKEFGPQILETPAQAIELLTHPKLGEAQGSKGVVDGMFDASDRPEGGDLILWWNDIEKDERYTTAPTAFASS